MLVIPCSYRYISFIRTKENKMTHLDKQLKSLAATAAVIKEPVINVDTVDKIIEELIGATALNPWAAYNSSPRGVMFLTQFSQAVTLINSTVPVIQTGLERQLANNTFSIKVPFRCKVIKVIPRYGMATTGIEEASITLIVKSIEAEDNGKLGCIVIPKYHSLHQYFGFQYNWAYDIDRIQTGTILEAGTILADSPNVKDNGMYGYGLTMNLLLGTLPTVGEDAVVISKSAARRFAYYVYEKRSVDVPEDMVPLDIHGSEEGEYKTFSDIGELVGEDSVLMALRAIRPDDIPAMFSNDDVRHYNPDFDIATYVKKPGEVNTELGYQIVSGEIIDIKVHTNKMFKPGVDVPVAIEQIKKYVDGMDAYYTAIMNTYNAEAAQARKRGSVNITPELSSIVQDAIAISNQERYKISLVNRNTPIQAYRIEFTVKYLVVPTIGAKLTDRHGAKGIVTEVRDDALMPDGVDVIMDPSSIPGRMNIGRLYEQFMHAMSRHTQQLVRNRFGYDITLLTKDDVLAAYSIIYGLYELVDKANTITYPDGPLTHLGKELTYEEIYDVVKNAMEDEVYLYYTVSNDKNAYQIVLDTVASTEYMPPISTITMYDNDPDGEQTEDPILIGGIYMMLLGRIPDNFLSAASARLNNYQMPISMAAAAKHRYPFRITGTKNISETEGRLYAGFGKTIQFAMELKNRANSIETHKLIYRQLLTAEHPANIEALTQRNPDLPGYVPYNDDAAIKLTDALLSSIGLELKHMPSADMDIRNRTKF